MLIDITHTAMYDGRPWDYRYDEACHWVLHFGDKMFLHGSSCWDPFGGWNAVLRWREDTGELGYDNKLLYYTHQVWYDVLFPCRMAGMDLEKMRKDSNWYKEAMNVYIPM